ncbi:hypothetical protein [Curtobacterium flaccumfaciens]|uniref:hypothetical protein n=1 Tax=Curtobacterium flaccumfaciens TaxID=2035 RepID=UPI0038794637
MFGIPKPSNADVAAAPIWSADGIQARATLMPLKRGKSRHVVEITCGVVVAYFATIEVTSFLMKRHFVVESVTEPLVYLCWPEGVDSRSAAAPLVSGVDDDSVLIVEESESVAPLAVLTGPVKKSFVEWFETLGKSR